MNFWKVADLWHTLMTGTLGHDRYAAAGCDVGALVTGATGPGTSAVAGTSPTACPPTSTPRSSR
jgi:hypothetical protein